MDVFADLGRFALKSLLDLGDSHDVALHDLDTRRTIIVSLPSLPNARVLDPEHDPGHYDDYSPDGVILKHAVEVLEKHIAELPADAVAIQVDASGNLRSICTDPERDLTMCTDYFLLEEYQLPSRVKTVLRSELTEIRRFVAEPDLVSYPPSLCSSSHKNRHVFKYSTGAALGLWKEVQILERLPHHPNLVPIDRLVLDEATGSRVVGFTMPYMAGGSLDRSRPPLKLKWLMQLMQLVDELHLKHRLVHRDIAARNPVVNPDSDSIILIDFNVASSIGISEEDLARADVTGVMFFAYEYITRDPALERGFANKRVYEKDIEEPAKWIKHPGVQLDRTVADFYFELMAWVRARRAGKPTTHLPEPLVWPNASFNPSDIQYPLCTRHKAGLPYIEWKRPASNMVDPTRRLLATGRYAGEAAAPDHPATTSQNSAGKPRRHGHPAAASDDTGTPDTLRPSENMVTVTPV